jgi:hypothetical protein
MRTGLLVVAGVVTVLAAQDSGDIPKSFVAPLSGYDYDKREAMIPIVP